MKRSSRGSPRKSSRAPARTSGGLMRHDSASGRRMAQNSGGGTSRSKRYIPRLKSSAGRRNAFVGGKR